MSRDLQVWDDLRWPPTRRPETATINGHSLKGVEAILDKDYLGRDVRLAENAMGKLEENEERAIPSK